MQAQRCGLEGKVVVEFTVTTSGEVRNPVIVNASHRIFLRPTLDAMQRIVCEPTDRNVRVQLPVTFKLRGLPPEHSVALACMDDELPRPQTTP